MCLQNIHGLCVCMHNLLKKNVNTTRTGNWSQSQLQTPELIPLGRSLSDCSSVKSLSFASPPSTEIAPRQKRCVDDYLPNSRVEKLRTNKNLANGSVCKADIVETTGNVDSGALTPRVRRRVRHLSETGPTEESDVCTPV